MRGIDIYHGDSINETSTLKSVPEKAYKESDFVIVKSTQGVSYKYTSFFHAMIKRCLDDGKLTGAYHYAAGNDPVKEADYFLSVVKPYLGKIILCLDWEGNQNKKFGSKTWCKKFIDRVKAKTGIRCMLYTGEDGCDQNKDLAGKVPLWFARYPKPQATGWDVPKFNWKFGAWDHYDIWQYSSTNEKCDRNTTDLTKKEWNSMRDPATPSPARHLQLLAIYHEYIKKHSSKIINKYDSDVVKFFDMKKLVKAGKKCGITCAVPNRLALYDMGIKGYGGKYLITAEDGSFGQYYAGDVKTYFERITKGGPIGLSVRQAVDKGLLKDADIVCFNDLTHMSIYSGSGCKMYEGGSGCVQDGHYPNGIIKDYSKIYADRKISEVLRWRNAPAKKQETTTTVKTTAKSSADAFVSQAKSWLGCKESDGSHKKIIDKYNSHKPLARGYKVKYTDSWCATFVSACAIACGYTDIIPLECSCEKMIELAKKKGIWIENENRTPSPGEIILYDWQDSGSGDDKGAADHVGIVEKVSGKTITVIEGNYSDSVKRREVQVNGKYIRGYICPKFDTKSTSTATTAKASTSTKSLPVGKSKDKFTRSGTGQPKKTEYIKGKVTASALNVRTWAGSKNPNIKSEPTLKKGATVSICDAILDSNKTTWYYIKTAKGHYGFVSGKFISKA